MHQTFALFILKCLKNFSETSLSFKKNLRKNDWPSETLKIIQKKLFPLSHAHRLIDNLQLNTMSQTLIENSRQREKKSDWKFHSLTFFPPVCNRPAKAKMLNGVWFDYKGTKGFFMSLVYLHRKKIQSQNVNKFSLQILSLSLSLIMNTVYLHPGGGGGCIWVCLCCSGSSCRGSLRAREQRVHGLDAYLLQAQWAQWAGDGLWGDGGGRGGGNRLKWSAV